MQRAYDGAGELPAAFADLMLAAPIGSLSIGGLFRDPTTADSVSLPTNLTIQFITTDDVGCGDVTGRLENPQPDSFQSGASVISGWVCQASSIEISIDGQIFEAAYGTSREDTRGICGDANNGFGLLFNWNLVGDGLHEVRAFADGVEFGQAIFSVTTLGPEFLTGASGSFLLENFPDPGTEVTVQWEESLQNFVITGQR